MKNRIIYTLCAALCCAVFLQNVFAQDKSAAKLDGKAATTVTQSQPSLKLASVNKIASENAKVTLVVEEGDSEYGYQILIDKDFNICDICSNV